METKEKFKEALRTLVGTLAAQGNMGLVPPAINESIMEECPESALYIINGLKSLKADKEKLRATFYLSPDGGRTIRHEVMAEDMNHDDAYTMAKGMVHAMSINNKHPKVSVEIISLTDYSFHDDFSVDTIDCGIHK